MQRVCLYHDVIEEIYNQNTGSTWISFRKTSFHTNYYIYINHLPFHEWKIQSDHATPGCTVCCRIPMSYRTQFLAHTHTHTHIDASCRTLKMCWPYIFVQCKCHYSHACTRVYHHDVTKWIRIKHKPKIYEFFPIPAYHFNRTTKIRLRHQELAMHQAIYLSRDTYIYRVLAAEI